MEMLLAGAIVFLIQLRDNKPIRAAIIESGLCALLARVVSEGIQGNYIIFAGGCIGCIGFSNSVGVIKGLLKKRGVI